jgi:hypothetical protein
MADDLLARLDRIVHSDAPYGTTLRDTVRDAAAEVRALRTAVRYLSKVADQGGPSNWRDFIAHPEVADAVRAATADPTPQTDTDRD